MSATDEIRGNAHRAREHQEVLLITPDAAEALCDVADAARALYYSGGEYDGIVPPWADDVYKQHDATIAEALARLDGEGRVMASSDDGPTQPAVRTVLEQLHAGTLPEPNRRQLLAAVGHSTNCVSPDHYRKVWQEERDRAEHAKRAYEDAEDRAERAERARDKAIDAYRAEVGIRERVKADNDRLRERLDEAHLARIEAQNPGIDIERVREQRGEWGDALSADADAGADAEPETGGFYHDYGCSHDPCECSGEPSRAEGDCLCGPNYISIICEQHAEGGRPREADPQGPSYAGGDSVDGGGDDGRARAIEAAERAEPTSYYFTAADGCRTARRRDNREAAEAAIDAALASGGVVLREDADRRIRDVERKHMQRASEDTRRWEAYHEARVHTLEVALRRLLEFVEPQGLCLCHGQGMCAVCRARKALEGGGS